MGKPHITWLFRCYVFFSSIVKQLNDGYPQLFQKDSEEDVQKGEGSEEERRANGRNGEDSASSFSNKWEWISWISDVSKEIGVSWFEVYKTTAMFFLNVICFLIDKSNEEKRQIEQWKRKH